MFAVSLLSFTLPKMLGTLERCACTVRKRSSPRAVSALSARFALEASSPMNSTISDSLAFKRAETYRVIAFTDIHRVVVIRVVAAIFRDELE